jgi:hypothetical protein
MALAVALVAVTAPIWVHFAGAIPGSAPRSEESARSVTTRPNPVPRATTEPAPVQVWPPTSMAPAPTVGRDGRTWQVGAPGDLVVVSQWGCAAEPTAALLRPETGQVWYFTRWAGAGEHLDAVAVATVAGGRSADARDVDGDSCAELVVTRDSGEPVVVHPEAGT